MPPRSENAGLDRPDREFERPVPAVADDDADRRRSYRVERGRGDRAAPDGGHQVVEQHAAVGPFPGTRRSNLRAVRDVDTPVANVGLQRAGMKIDDIDLYEVNEAFAPVPIAWLKHHGADPAKLNVNGGAIALGHPLGASGTKLMTTLIYALRARGKKYGLQTMCEGGGIANVTIIEAL